MYRDLAILMYRDVVCRVITLNSLQINEYTLALSYH